MIAEQAQYLTNGVQPLAGVYAVNIWIDPTTGTESRTLVDVIDEMDDGNWSVILDANGIALSTPISSTIFPTTSDLQAYFEQEALQPIGFLHLDDDTEPTDPGDGGGDGNHTGLALLDEDNKTLQITSQSPFSYFVPYTGTGTFFASGLLPGLSINQAVGEISGTTPLLSGNSQATISLNGLDSEGNAITVTKLYFLEVTGSEDNSSNDVDHTDPGSGGGDYNGTEGLPVYALSVDQAINMTDGVLVGAGDYALEIYYDEVTFTEIKQLVPRFNLTAIGLGKSMVSEIRLMAPFFPPPSSQPQRKSKVTSLPKPFLPSGSSLKPVTTIIPIRVMEVATATTPTQDLAVVITMVPKVYQSTHSR